MTASSPVTDFLAMNGMRFPNMALYLMGIVFAVVTWRRHPLASRLSLVAFAIFFADTLLGAVFYWLVLRSDAFGDSGIESRGLVLSIGNGFFTLLNIVAWGLLLVALFARRPQQPVWDADASDQFRRPFAEPAAPPRRSGPPSEDIQL